VNPTLEYNIFLSEPMDEKNAFEKIVFESEQLGK